MKNAIKIFEFYDLLTRKERTEVVNWLIFQLGTADHAVIQLFKALKGKKNPQRICDSIFPGQSYKSRQFVKLCEKLREELEGFFAWKGLRKDKRSHERFMLQNLRKRTGTSSLFEKELKKTINRLENKELRDLDYFFHRVNLEALKRHTKIKHSLPNKGFWESDQLINQMESKLLIEYFKGELLKHIDPNYTPVEQQPVLSLHVPQKPTFRHATVKLYFSIWQFICAKAAIPFEEVKEIFASHMHSLPKDEQMNLCNLITNSLIKTHNEERSTESRNTLMEMYQFMIKENLIMIDNVFPIRPFKSMIILYLEKGQVEEAQAFLNTFGNFLEEDEQEDAIRYNWALIKFHEKRFRDAREILNGRPFHNSYYEISSSILKIKAQYEEDGGEDLEDQIHALKRRIRKTQSVSELFKSIYLGHLDILGAMVMQEPKEKVRHMLSTSGNIHFKSWLEEKLEQYSPI